MPSAVEECREPSGECRGISHCLEGDHSEETASSVHFTVSSDNRASLASVAAAGINCSYATVPGTFSDIAVA